jgi:purine-binding chemotaxis protein CheW
VVQVVDLIELFTKSPAEITKRSCIVIVEHSRQDGNEKAVEYTGILVDTVNEVVEIKSTDIEPPPSFGSNMSTEFILGMAKVGSEIIILLNIDHLLTFERLSEMGQLDIQSLKEKTAASAE